MGIKKLIIVASIIFLWLPAFAQAPEEKLEKWAGLRPIEKIHLHFDRENYLAGETSWFKAYLYSDYLPDTISTTLYLELVKDSSNVLVRKILPVGFGVTNGQIEIPDTLTTGTYFVKAWTPTMLNQDGNFIFTRPVFIVGKKTKTDLTTQHKPKTRMEFFPESGNFLGGIQNTIAFKATGENGLPVRISGSVFNDKNEVVLKFHSYHDGMGMFEITPSADKYYAVLENDATGLKYELPVPVKEGTLLAMIPHPQGQFFEIKKTGRNDLHKPAYMVGQMQHHIVFRQEFNPGKDSYQGVINTQKLHSGILQVTVFNGSGLPLAERLCFVDNKEYVEAATLTTDTLSLDPKGRNHFNIKLKDTIQGNFSISVNDADLDLYSTRTSTIYSQLLLTSDLKGYIHNPAFYFSGNNDSITTALDLVMMTNGWRRFKWTELKNNPSPATYKDPGFINLNGRITLRGTKKPFENKAILLYMVSADSARSIFMTNTDLQGNFKLDSLLFFGPTKIVFSDIRGKKSQFIDAHLSADSLARIFTIPHTWGPSFISSDMIPGYKLRNLEDEFDIIRRANGIMLQGVTIKVRKKSPIEELEEKYASGLFSGFSEKTYDLTNTTETDGYITIFDYLRFRVPGLDISLDGLDYSVYYRQAGNASSMGLIPMTFYLDEIPADASIIATVNPREIAMVKIYSSFVGATGNAAGGVMALYTKKGEDLFNTGSTRAAHQRYTGFSVIKEFYSPDYKIDLDARNKPDTRNTLQWKPDIMVNGINPTIPLIFYNNDRTKRFHVIVEGITSSGKMVMIEKIVEAKKE